VKGGSKAAPGLLQRFVTIIRYLFGDDWAAADIFRLFLTEVTPSIGLTIASALAF
jgi:hypothetical protein